MHANAPETASAAGDEGLLVAELRSLKSQHSPRGPRVAKALQALEQTKSSRVRNAAAVALADLRAQSARDALVGLLTRSDTRGSRGSLLYALAQLGADLPLPILAEIIVGDAYEAREEALSFIASDRIECSAEAFADAKAALEAAIASADAERLDTIQRALKFLRVKHYHDVRR